MSDTKTEFLMGFNVQVEPNDVVVGLNRNDDMVYNFITEVIELLGSSDVEMALFTWLEERDSVNDGETVDVGDAPAEPATKDGE